MQFDVINYEQGDFTTEVYLLIGRSRTSFQIDKRKFEQWLERTDRLDWSMVGPDKQVITGRATTEEYWQHDAAVIKKDLHDYIELKHSDFISNYSVYRSNARVLSDIVIK